MSPIEKRLTMQKRATTGEERRIKTGREKVQKYRKGNEDRETEERIRDGEGVREGRMNRDWCQ